MRARACRAKCGGRQREGWIALAVAALALALPAGAGAADLGTLGGGSSYAAAVNASGEAVGWSATAAGAVHAFSWTSEGGMIDLGTLGGENSRALLVSSAGQVVGTSETSSGATHAFSWTPARGMVDIGTLGGAESRPAAVNAAGQVVGSADTASGQVHAFWWKPGHRIADLGTLGGENSAAEALNDSGETVGWAEAQGGREAFVWSKAQGMSALGGGAVTAKAINDAGQIVGAAQSGGHLSQPFVWTPSRGFEYLAGDGEGADASGVNEAGQTIGAYEEGHGDSAFVWDPPGDAVFLGAVPECCGASPAAIDGEGEVVGSSGEHGFAWTSSRGLIDLGPGSATDVNDEGEVSGAAVAGGAEHAVLWNTSAGPEWGRCVKQAASSQGSARGYTGRFASASCVRESATHSGRYEWSGGVFETGFSLVLTSGAVTLETTGRAKVTCTSASGHGFYAGSKEVEGVVLALGGCESGEQRCASPEQGEALLTAPLEGTLGWVERAAGKVALELHAPAGAGPLMSYSCGSGALTEVTGSVLVPLAANKMLRAVTLRYRQSAGRQTPERFEGGPAQVLMAAAGGQPAQQLGLAGTFTLVGEEAVEIATSAR